MLKPRFAAALALLALGAMALGQNVPTSAKLLSDATALAAKEKKNVWVTFTASWCGWCKKMDAFRAVPENKKILDKYFVVVHVTVLESPEHRMLENPGGDQLLVDLKGDKQGIPFFAFLDSKGKMIVNSRRTTEGNREGSNVGHPVAPEEIAWFMEMLKKGAPKMTSSERTTIETWLKAQKIG